jgi:ATP-dependent DNA ligase
MCAHNLEGIVAKRLKDPYGPRVRWLKVKTPSYSQNEGRCELFDRQRDLASLSGSGWSLRPAVVVG